MIVFTELVYLIFCSYPLKSTKNLQQPVHELLSNLAHVLYFVMLQRSGLIYQQKQQIN